MKHIDINVITEDFTKVIQFKIITKIREYWKTLDNFKAEWDFQRENKGVEANRIFKKIWRCFNVDTKTIRSLTQAPDGTKQAKKVKANLDPMRLVFVGKKTATYQSGKKFETDSWFYIPFEELSVIWNYKSKNLDPFDFKSDYYTDAQRELIAKYILNIGKKERAYNKTEAFFIYQAKKHKAEHQQLTEKDLDELIEELEVKI